MRKETAVRANNIKNPSPDTPLKLNLGCGHGYLEGFINIDVGGECWGKEIHADVYHDLNFGIPADSDSVDEIYTTHCLEHLENPYHMLREIHRVCMDRAEVYIVVPLMNYDLTHKFFFPDFWFERFINKEKFEILSHDILRDLKYESQTWDEVRVKLKIIKKQK